MALFFIFRKRYFIKGLICRIEGQSFYLYDSESEELIRCSLKGKFKNDYKLKKDKLYLRDIAAVGDSVDYELNADGSGVISTIHKRRNYISRKSPKQKGAGYRGERLEQVVASNIDNFFVVCSTVEPDFNNKVVDRLIVIGESANIENIYIVFNKTDLCCNEEIKFYEDLYTSIGYKVISASAKSGAGIDSVRHLMQGHINLVWGQSGVGKSSLLNAVFPSSGFKVGVISAFNSKGRHTTVTSSMIKTDINTYIIDTPGIREIDPFGIKKEDLSHYFVEFANFNNNCRFNTCTHNHEPGCGILAALEDNKIFPERYDSYLRLLETVEDDIVF